MCQIGRVLKVTIGTVITCDQLLALQPLASLTFTLKSVDCDILLYITGLFTPHNGIVRLFQLVPVLYWNLYLLTGIDVVAVKTILSPKKAGLGSAKIVTEGTGLTVIVTLSVLIQAFASVKVTVYTVVVFIPELKLGFCKFGFVNAEGGDQLYVPILMLVAVKGIGIPPLQIFWFNPATTEGFENNEFPDSEVDNLT